MSITFRLRRKKGGKPEVAPRGRAHPVGVGASAYSTRPYLILMRSSFSSMGSASTSRKKTVAAAWTQSMGKPVT